MLDIDLVGKTEAKDNKKNIAKKSYHKYKKTIKQK